MKSIKIIAITLLMSSALALASDQQKPEDRQFQREQESKNRSALANAKAADEALAEQLQVDVDAAQFMKHQGSKMGLAPLAVENPQFTDEHEEESCILLAQAFEKMPGKKIRPKQIIQDAPKEIRTLIAQMHVEGKRSEHRKKAARFIGENTLRLVAATTSKDSGALQMSELDTSLSWHAHRRRAFEQYMEQVYPSIIDRRAEQSNYKKTLLGAYILGRGRMLSNDEFDPTITLADLLGRPLGRSEIAHVVYSDGSSKFMISLEDFKSLTALSLKQLHFINSLYQRRRDPLRDTLALPLFQLKKPFAAEDEQIFKSLPSTMRANLVEHYNLDWVRPGIVRVGHQITEIIRRKPLPYVFAALTGAIIGDILRHYSNGNQ